MTVAELITELQKLPQHLPVYYSGRDYETTDVESVEILALGTYRRKIWPERVMLT